MTTPLNSYLITFRDGTTACVDGASGDEARQTGEALQGQAAATWAQLPNPAEPRLNALVPGPAYCTQPHVCAGSHACTKRFDCAS